MDKNNFSAIIDLGNSNLRLGIFDNNYMNLYSSSKSVVENGIEENFSYTLNSLIRDAEKKISNHIKNIIVMYDSSEIYSIDISLKKSFDQKMNVKKISLSLLTEANQLVKNIYISKKIIHFSITNYNIDDQDYPNEVNNVDDCATSFCIWWCWRYEFVNCKNNIYGN